MDGLVIKKVFIAIALQIEAHINTLNEPFIEITEIIISSPFEPKVEFKEIIINEHIKLSIKDGIILLKAQFKS